MNARNNSRANKDYALFFAVNDYVNMTDLNNPIQNALDIAEELRTDYGFITEVLKNPSLTTIEEKLAEYKAKFASGVYDQKGQLLIFFTGHGTMQGRNGYFMPSDVTPNIPHRTGLDYDYLRYNIDGFACQHILVAVDACHSGTFDPDYGKNDRNFGRKGADKDQVLIHHKSYRARLFITSDAQGDETPDNSNLVRKWLLALRSHRSATGYLTHDELMGTYLKQANPIPGGGEFGSDEPASRFLFFRKVFVDYRDEISAWEEAKTIDNCEGYRSYLHQYPNSDFSLNARRKINSCVAEERMLTAWDDSKIDNSEYGYARFMEDFPNSPLFEVAEYRHKYIKDLRVSRTEQVIPVLSEPTKMIHSENGIKERAERLEERIARYKFLLSKYQYKHIHVDETNGVLSVDRIYFKDLKAILDNFDKETLTELSLFMLDEEAKDFNLRFEGYDFLEIIESYFLKLGADGKRLDFVEFSWDEQVENYWLLPKW